MIQDKITKKTNETTNVIVVDDYIPILKLIEKSFEYENIQVTTCENSSTAIDQIMNNNFDLAILDIMMPEITGYDICKVVREKFSMYQLPILFITAKTNINDIIEALECGGNDYLPKPFNSKELIARARNLIKLKKLTDTNTILQDAIKIKDNFVSMNIHDLKNPLTAIQLNAEILKLTSTNEQQDKSIRVIQDSSILMLNLINEILDISKIEHGKYVLNKSEFPVIEVVNDIIYRNTTYARKKQQNIQFLNETDIDTILYADKEKIYQAIDNLINNAIKYSPIGSNIKIQSKLNFDKFFLEIIDEGPGFSDEDKKNLFEKFRKLSAKPTAGENSSGLGLSISKEIIDMHKGSINLESIPGKGSKFTLILNTK